MNGKIRFGLIMPLFLFLYLLHAVANGCAATEVDEEEGGNPPVIKIREETISAPLPAGVAEGKEADSLAIEADEEKSATPLATEVLVTEPEEEKGANPLVMEIDKEKNGDAPVTVANNGEDSDSLATEIAEGQDSDPMTAGIDEEVDDSLATEIDEENGDPLQGMNRAFYGINDIVDRALVKPIAEVYVDHVHSGVRKSISNVFDNLAYLGVVINDILQGKLVHAVKDTGRFVVNSTIGIVGIFDPATSMGLERHDEDFGQTLGVWGAGEGAYLVLPALGPSSFRDVPGVVMGFFTDLLYYMDSGVMLPLMVVKVIDYRASMLDITRKRDESMLDPYLVTRSVYRQTRNELIYDGNVPFDEEDYLSDMDEPDVDEEEK
uniref:ABC-type transporter Mla maintaining outer membrane lipid asymmetry, lipoprotein component MlaA n=1 Tax=Candidatus Kentrum sp. FM TaxID=2126340 RepID=A0A450T9Q2_9GAMM|nr:MAG: ABC-type transporter Mla maintaining outer membrane lipid asymmetry, lipoprotein component MlaA [Candidatus Kentron sp. FM]VFJ63423.1 MAG: ABC-type transporter Mla maintaining outer membrane lipid asymmetry, lipoprotein component MlaA [Candidatus Kentron sp. FM]VFK14773.1 MAG: ABC-type transporter Mla maintaining outer membrane lipid asymmetry, lipoprotein component MlaA [Candidatus Kentron sp. FM]